MGGEQYDGAYDDAKAFDRSAKWGAVRLEWHVAHKCAQSCVAVVGKLLNVQAQVDAVHLPLDILGTLENSANTESARKYLSEHNVIADDFGNAVDWYRSVMQLLADAFVRAGKAFENNDADSAKNFADITVPDKPPSSGAGAFVDPKPPPAPPPPYHPRPDGGQQREPFPLDNPDSYGYPDLSHLQQGANPKGVNQVALVWGWLANEMEAAFGDFAAEITAIPQSDWSGNGRETAISACTAYVELAKTQIAAMRRLGDLGGYVASQVALFQAFTGSRKNVNGLRSAYRNNYSEVLRDVYSQMPDIKTPRLSPDKSGTFDWQKLASLLSTASQLGSQAQSLMPKDTPKMPDMPPPDLPSDDLGTPDIGGGGGGSAGGGAPLGVPVSSALFPRATPPASTPSATRPQSQSPMAGMPGTPGGMGAGAGMGQGQNSKRARYLDSAENLEEVLGDSPGAVKPVVGGKTALAGAAEGRPSSGPLEERENERRRESGAGGGLDYFRERARA
ncbi:hypothetical protein [Nocardia sp. NPDC127526]|uniref:hypothetical protein n=1 Tax=Nocardia sp. NPDC127526 TaxID=3345393 RepID=UPI00362A2517